MFIVRVNMTDRTYEVTPVPENIRNLQVVV